jgi:hypothetical protein
VIPFKLRNLRDTEDKQILIWSAIFNLTFLGGPRARTLRTAKQDRSARKLKQKTLNHWVVDSIPTRCTVHVNNLRKIEE